MKLTQLIPAGAVKPGLVSVERNDAIAELVDVLIACGAASPKLREELIKSVLEREKRGSTGFGRGVAVPHVKHKTVNRMVAAVGLSSRGVEFNALDRQPVFSIFLLLSPEDRPEEHLQAMEVIFKNLSKDTFRRLLRQSQTPDEVRALLEEADNQLLTG
ncbi:MAG: PTS sugar transporter subunit IIA [Phycisphaerales bacterium]